MKEITCLYTIFSESGTILDSNRDKKPLRIRLGSGQFIPYIESCLEDVQAGESRVIPISPEQGFGAHDPDLVKKTKRDNLPLQWQQVGTLVELVDELTGQIRGARLVAMSETEATLDFNHPFAGKDIICTIDVLDVVREREAPA